MRGMSEAFETAWLLFKEWSDWREDVAGLPQIPKVASPEIGSGADVRAFIHPAAPEYALKFGRKENPLAFALEDAGFPIASEVAAPHLQSGKHLPLVQPLLGDAELATMTDEELRYLMPSLAPFSADIMSNIGRDRDERPRLFDLGALGVQSRGQLADTPEEQAEIYDDLELSFPVRRLMDDERYTPTNQNLWSFLENIETQMGPGGDHLTFEGRRVA